MSKESADFRLFAVWGNLPRGNPFEKEHVIFCMIPPSLYYSQETWARCRHRNQEEEARYSWFSCILDLKCVRVGELWDEKSRLGLIG